MLRVEKAAGRGALLLTMVSMAYVSGFLGMVQAQSLQVSGGLDARMTNERESLTETGPFQPQLTGAFLNLRKVWSDGYGDRWIGVAQADFDDNFQRVRVRSGNGTCAPGITCYRLACSRPMTRNASCFRDWKKRASAFARIPVWKCSAAMVHGITRCL